MRKLNKNTFHGILIFAGIFSFFQPIECVGATNITITDIATWKHPTKKVFEANGITLTKVVLLDKVKPIFYVELPLNAAACDAEGLNGTLGELAKANSYWSFRVLDSTAKEIRLDAEVTADPKKKALTKIDFLKYIPCPGDYNFHRVMQTPKGNIDIYDVSKNADANAYRIAFSGKKILFEENEYSLESIKKLPVGKPDSIGNYFLLDFVGPGMNCHDHYRLIEMNSVGNPALSDPFGNCMDFNQSALQGDTLILKMAGSLDQNQSETFKWHAGRFIKGK